MKFVLLCVSFAIVVSVNGSSSYFTMKPSGLIPQQNRYSFPKFNDYHKRPVKSRRCYNVKPVDFLISMSGEELLNVGYCAATSGKKAQNSWEACGPVMAHQVMVAFRKCQADEYGYDLSGYYPAIARNPNLVTQIAECMQLNIDELNEKEKRQQLEFEDCSRKVFEDYCSYY